jgi:uncharacterized protein (TIGR03067 family)
VPPALAAGTVRAAGLLAAGQAAGAVSGEVAALTEGVLNAMLWGTLKKVAGVLVLVLAVCGGGLVLHRAVGAQQGPPEKVKDGGKAGRAPAAPRDGADAIKAERKRFEGAWKLVAIEANGKKASQRQVEEVSRLRAEVLARDLGMRPARGSVGGFVVVHDGEGRWTEQTGKGTVLGRGTSKIDPGKNPKTIDETGTRVGAKAEKTRLGIYEFVNADTYSVCMAAPGEKRPAKFSTKGQGGHAHWVFQRVKKDGGGKREP